MAEFSPAQPAAAESSTGAQPVMGQMARGAAWMIGFRAAERGLGLVSLLILARLLLPEDFGLVAIATSVVALIEIAGAFGFDVALIQHRDPKREHFDTVFTMNVLLGVGGGAVLAALAPATASYFGDGRLVAIMQILAIAWAVQGFENVGPVMFRREMNFRREFVFLTSKRLLTFVITLVAAFVLRTYWALVIGIVTGRVAMVVLSFAMHPYRPRFSLTAVRELMSFSAWLFLGNVLGFFVLRLSTFVVGRTDGPREVGYYTLAYEVGTLPTSELLAPINRAIIPGFARMAQDPQALGRGFLDVMGTTAIFVVPAAFGIAAVAEPAVRVLLTDKWSGAVPLLQILAFLGATAAIIASAFPAFYALGRPRAGAMITSVRLAIMVPAMIWAGNRWGVLGVAWADLAAALLALPFGVTIACRALGIPVTALVARIWRPLVASAVMYWAVHAFLMLVHQTYPGISGPAELVSGIVAGLIAYSVLVAGLWLVSGRGPGTERLLLSMLEARRK
ncbi:MAG: lipopolysaccharide biosynthesis protein [Gammaproteobacteria bacterium]